MLELAVKYKIPSDDTISKWILKYNGHEKLKAFGTGGKTIMTKGRKTTFEERVEIVQYCIAHEHNYSVQALCKLGRVSRAGYYKWLKRNVPLNESENRLIADEIEKIHRKSPDKGYRRIRDDLERYHDIKVNDKRVLRICRKLDIQSTIKYKNNGCTRQAKNPQFIAENLLNREFIASAPNEKWLTDAGMTQSMSRVGKCIDNGPMEGFWGIIKRERYYGKQFANKISLVKMLEEYIHYYNNIRLQRNLGVLTPMEKHEIYLHAA